MKPGPALLARVRLMTVLGGLALGLAALVTIALTFQADAAFRWVVSSQNTATEVQRLLERLIDAETGARGFVITGDESYLDPYQGAEADVKGSLARLREMSAGDPLMRARLDSLDGIIHARLELANQLVAARRIGAEPAQQLVRTNRGKFLMEEIRDRIAEIEQDQQQRIAERQAAQDRWFHRLRISVIAALLLAFTISALLVRGIMVQLRARHEQAELLRQQALEDELTGLPNRRTFFLLGRECLLLSDRLRRAVVLVYADLNGFKVINDTWGHGAGDQALRDFAGVLRTTFRGADVVARMGGDEFAVLALEEAPAEGEFLRDRFLGRLEQFNQRQERPYTLRASVGVCRREPGVDLDLEALIARGDESMYRQKQAGSRG